MVACEKDSLVFEPGRAVKITDADGKALSHEFKNVTYQSQNELIIADFHEPHGFGLSIDKTRLTFKIINKENIQLMGRQDKSRRFLRCPN